MHPSVFVSSSYKPIGELLDKSTGKLRTGSELGTISDEARELR